MTFLLALFLQIAYPPPPPAPAVFQAVQQAPKPVLPADVRGPHEGEANAFCSRSPTFTHAGQTVYECHCEFICEMGAGGERLQREANSCVTACGKDQCNCHLCESCDLPPEPK
jgi:hypothetical protein